MAHGYASVVKVMPVQEVAPRATSISAYQSNNTSSSHEMATISSTNYQSTSLKLPLALRWRYLSWRVAPSSRFRLAVKWGKSFGLKIRALLTSVAADVVTS